jgi:hypothetical protein
MKTILNIFFVFTVCLLTLRCQEKPQTLFEPVSSDQTGITFSNEIQENDTFNILTYEYIYNGGGVAVADFNNDDRQDVFFTGNLVPNKLYLNKGDLRFEDITEVAAVNVAGRWNSGVSVVDINNDGWNDLYVCATMHADSANRRNMLFINNGLNKDGIPTFTNRAAEYGLEDGGYSVASAFFDYDRDGDLDVYVLINERLKNLPTNYRPKIVDGSSPNNDELYRNNGNGTFTKVTKEAGITIEGFGLGLAVADVNVDGWPDIYVSNDYLSNDVLYINNKNGTFTNRIADFVGHQSQFSMGNDVADVNNDALPDIITLDMLPETNDRKKTTISNKSYQTYINNETFKYEYQYVRNMLHLNNGLDHDIKFSEIGQLSGIHQTEWSWSPLFADFDNDGNKDLIITNGFPKDITDKDFANYRADVGNLLKISELKDSIPVIRIPNYAFRNNGDLVFSDVTKQWGLDAPSFSNGAAFADLDNDGDLDYVVNNINETAFVYRNTLNDTKAENSQHNNWLRLKLEGDKNNRQGIGAKVTVYMKGKPQYQENTIYRGFLSSVESIIHFGLADATMADSVFIQWPDDRIQTLRDVKANQVLAVKYKPEERNKPAIINQEVLVSDISTASGILYKHTEDDKIDFNLQRTLPHKFSQSGPGVSVGDINNDGREDLIVGGSSQRGTTVFIQRPDGTFLKKPSSFSDTKKEEDEGLLLFDADGDKDLDLYIVSGSVESPAPADYEDRLYLNNGKGDFSLAANALPETNASGSCVRAADYDSDGDLDLFVAGRVVPGSYPSPAQSYLLRNDGGKFADVTSEVSPSLKAAGMIADALWSDFNHDNAMDLIVVGEFMPVTFFKNESGKLVRVSDTGVDQYVGWWNSLTAADFDKDGDTDYIAGNLGLNNNYQVTEKYPLQVVAKDFDGNGSVDPITVCYMRESMTSDTKKQYPVHFWDELNSQSPKFRNKFSRYRQYSKITIDQLLTPEERKDALVLNANHMATSYLSNNGNGKFTLMILPVPVQVAPVNGLVVDDVNHDGNPDVLMTGNDYGNEVFAGRYDAFTGLVLLGDGRGGFEVVPSSRSGFYVKGDAKALAKLTGTKTDLYIATQNRDSLKVFATKGIASTELFHPELLDSWMELIYTDGRKQRVEFYYGSGYLSQSTRNIRVPAGVNELIVYNTTAKPRNVAWGINDQASTKE